MPHWDFKCSLCEYVEDRSFQNRTEADEVCIPCPNCFPIRALERQRATTTGMHPPYHPTVEEGRIGTFKIKVTR